MEILHNKMSCSHHQIIKDVKRLVIKVGSGILTTKKGVNASFFNSFAREVAALRKKGIEIVIVSSGAIACGMDILKLKNRPHKIPQKQAAAAMGQPLLMHHYSKSFKKRKIDVAQILITRDDLQNRHRFLTAKHALMEIFSWGAVAVVNENDSVSVEEIQVGDNDQLSALVAHLVDANLLVMCTDTDGLHDKDPKKFKDAKRIPVVTTIDEKILQLAEDTQSQKSIGGMTTKLMAAKQAAHYGVPTWIVCGKNPKILQQLFKGKDTGTLFLPRPAALSSRKYWIAYSRKPKGIIKVDDGAATAIIEKNKSLLSSGITEIKGNFDIGDPVTIMDNRNKPIAQGLTSYSSRELEKIKGARSSDIEKILGYKYYDEAVNRDDLVIL